MNQQTLLDYLKTNCRGRENAKTGEELRKLFGCHKRWLQQTIEQLRKELVPILSADQGPNKGYFWPETPEEAEACYRQMRNRAAHTFQTLGYIRLAVEKEFGKQMEMEFKETA